MDFLNKIDMRPAVILVALLILFHVCSAQTKYEPLIQRIALLKTYLDYLKKGYNVVKGGLSTVQELKKGEFNLHRGYFNGLREINPSIKQYSTVLETSQLYIQVMDECSKVRNMLNG